MEYAKLFINSWYNKPRVDMFKEYKEYCKQQYFDSLTDEEKTEYIKKKKENEEKRIKSLKNAMLALEMISCYGMHPEYPSKKRLFYEEKLRRNLYEKE